MSAETRTTTSADGTTIAYQVYGVGPALVLVGGATQRKEDWADLAEALVAAGLSAVTYDRRGRGDSGDTQPYRMDREFDDVAAVAASLAQQAGGSIHGHVNNPITVEEEMSISLRELIERHAVARILSADVGKVAKGGIKLAGRLLNRRQKELGACEFRR